MEGMSSPSGSPMVSRSFEYALNVNYTSKPVFLLTLAAFMLAGCGYATDSSDDYDLNEIKVDINIYMPYERGGNSIPNQTAAVIGTFEADYDDTGNPITDAYISAILDPSESYDLRLTGGDKVIVQDGTATKTLQPDAVFYSYKTYGAYFDTNYQGSANYVLRFERSDSEALIANVDISTFVNIVSPNSGQLILPNSEDIVMSWSGVDFRYMFDVSVVGNCFDRFDRDVGKGVYTFTIPAGTLRTNAANNSGCDGQIILGTSLTVEASSAVRDDSLVTAHLPDVRVPVSISF